LKQTVARLRRLLRRTTLPALMAFATLAALPAQARDLVVYGEPTLKPVLTSLGALWHAQGNSRVHVFVAPTDLSFEQIAREARCDVIFALAGPATDAAEKRKLFDPDSKVEAFSNSLVVVARASAAANADDLRAILAGKRLAIANPDRDIAGSDGLAALGAAGVTIDPRVRRACCSSSPTATPTWASSTRATPPPTRSSISSPGSTARRTRPSSTWRRQRPMPTKARIAKGSSRFSVRPRRRRPS
jgi:hypothetical protein